MFKDYLVLACFLARYSFITKGRVEFVALLCDTYLVKVISIYF